MSDEARSRASSGQFPLRGLMALPVGVGLLIALKKWLATNHETLSLADAAPGTLPTEWALVSECAILAGMILVAVRTKRARALLGSRESPTWHGAVLLLTSGFFVNGYGPWGGGLSPYGFCTWNLHSSPMLPIAVWFAMPMLYGAILTMTSFSTTLYGHSTAYRWRWAIGVLYLGGIALGTILFVSTHWADTTKDRTQILPILGLAGVALAAILATVANGRIDRSKALRMDLIAALWFLTSQGTTLGLQAMQGPGYLSYFGPGFWMEGVGAGLILAGACGQIVIGEARITQKGGDRGS